MKKLLSLLGSLALISSAATTIVACNKSDKTDLGKIGDTLTITSEKTVADFKAKVIEEIKKTDDFKDFDATEIEIFKDDGKTALTDDDIAASTKIKIKAKDDAKKTSGEKTITVTWTLKTAAKKNLSTLTVPTIQSAATANAFKTALVNELKKQTGFGSLTDTKIKIEKGTATGTDLTDGDITGATIQVFLSVETTGNTEFEGTKTLTVNWTVLAKKNLNTLTAPTIQIQANVVAFKTALVNELKKQTGFGSLTDTKIKIEKGTATGTDLADGDVNVAGTIKVFLSVETAGNTEFEGTHSFDVILAKKNLNTLTAPTIQIQANVVAFKTALVNELKKQTGFASLTDTKIKIEKGTATGTDLADGDVNVAGTIKVFLSVETAGNTEFEGTHSFDVILAKKNLNTLTAPTGLQPKANVVAFKTALVNELKKQTGFGSLTDTKIKIEKGTATGTDLADGDVNVAGTIKVFLSVETAGNAEFEGTHSFDVILAKKNLNTLTAPTGLQPKANVVAFKTALVNELKKQTGFGSLTDTKIKIEKGTATGTDLTDGDVNVAGTIKVFLSVETAGNAEFEGTHSFDIILV